VQIDHITVACATLEQGQAYAAKHWGVQLSAGGQHPLMGTHNLLTRVGQGVFLELIAIDPKAHPAPTRARWFELDWPATHQRLQQGPFLAGWVARTTGLAALLATPLGARLDTGPAVAAQRGDLRWQITVPDDGHHPHGGLLPTLIEWAPDAGVPGSRMAPCGLQLQALELHSPDAEPWRSTLAQAGWVDGAASIDNACVHWVPAAQPALVLRLHTPLGLAQMRRDLT
jgi:hypothetical protein